VEYMWKIAAVQHDTTPGTAWRNPKSSGIQVGWWTEWRRPSLVEMTNRIWLLDTTKLASQSYHRPHNTALVSDT